MRSLMVAVSVVGLCWVLATRADDPPAKKLTKDEREKLERELNEFNDAGVKAADARKLGPAVAAFEKAVATARKLYPADEFPDGHVNLARALTNLAGTLMDAEKFAAAEPVYREVVETYRRIHKNKDHADLVLALYDHAGSLRVLGRQADAEAELRAALRIAGKAFGEDSDEVVGLTSDLAVILTEQGKHEAAEPLLRDLLAASKKLHKGDHPEVAHRMTNLAGFLTMAGKHAEAEPVAEEAVAMVRRLTKEDHPQVATTLHNLGVVRQARGKLAAAEATFREELAVYRRLGRGDDLDVAATQRDLAFVLRAQGRWREAEVMNRAVLGVRTRLIGPDHRDTIQSLADLGDTLMHINPGEAEGYAREALARYQRLYPKSRYPDGHHDLLVALKALGEANWVQGKIARAVELAREALDMADRLHKGDHPARATALNNLAAMLQEQEEHRDVARRLHTQALEMRRRITADTDPGVAESLSNLGVLVAQMGDYEEAERMLREAVRLRQKLQAGDDDQVSASLNNLAYVLADRGKYDEALAAARESLAIKRRLHPGDHPDLAKGLCNLADTLRAAGNLKEAEPLFRDAARMYRTLAEVQAANSEGDALTLVASQPLARDGYLSVARPLGTAPAAVYAEVWAGKASVARVAERRALAARAATAPEATHLLDRLRAARRLRAELILAAEPKDPGTKAKRDADLEAFAREIQALEEGLRKHLPAVERLAKLAAAAPADLRARLPADAAFVDLLGYTHVEQDPKRPGKPGDIHTPRYTAFLVTRDAVRWIDLGPAEPVAGAVARWRQAITTPPFGIPPELPAKVRELVWAPIRGAIPDGVKVVYLSPDAALTRVPWAALPGDKPGTILLEDFAVAVVPHGPFLLDQLVPPDAPANRPTGLLAVGGVAYGGVPERTGVWGAALLAARGRSRELPVDPGQKAAWPDLPGARVEADQLVRRAADRKLDARLLTGAAASADRVLAELSKARYAHFATHGFFADRQFRSVMQLDPNLFEFRRGGRERVGAGAVSPMVMSGLVFAGANRPDTPGRGIVTGEALADRDLSGLELAVLSACETGLGDVAGGEGVFGLQRAFHLAGTKNVVASLWKVPDEPTAALMGVFYRNLWDKNLPPVEALCQAQLEIYRNPDKIAELARGFRGKFDEVPGAVDAGLKPGADGKAHPLLWAAFTLSGPGR